MNLAVIKTGGKQYVVTDKTVLNVEKLPGETGEKVTFDEVLLVAHDEAVEVGTPNTGKVVEAEILKQSRAAKVRVEKFKSKVRYHKVYGHRQQYTQVKITSIA